MTFFAIAAKCRAHLARFFSGYYLIQFMRISLLLIFIVSFFSHMLVASTVNGQQIDRVQMTIELNNGNLIDVFKKIESQTPFTFLYRNEDVSKIKSINIKATNITVSYLLQKLLQGSSLGFKQVGQRIVINKVSENKISAELTEPDHTVAAIADTTFLLSGQVVNGRSATPVAGATISGLSASTVSDVKGNFKIISARGRILRITHVGFEPVEITVTNQEQISISLKQAMNIMKEVVVNGLFTRKAETYTGSASTFTGQELKRVSNVNVLQSLAILDPSFHIVDNASVGSDPNKLPEVILRGPTGVPDLKSGAAYPNAPNLPLFILDGFETTIQRVNDLNMNLVASVTLLKDASAKAIYGSKAGNGVVVIETRRPAAGDLRVSYSGSLDITAPDLSSYHLTNSLQKIQAESFAGKYTSQYPELQYPLTQQYSANMQQALSGVNTYWLAKPLQNGIGQKHNLYVDGGSDGMRYAAGINYQDLAGVMKGSDRRTISGNVNLSYRKGSVSFSNSLTIDQNKATNSPYGDFSAYSKMNPYWKIYDENGNVIPSYQSFGATVYNPLYDATLNTRNDSHYTNITENFYGEWEAKKDLRFTARIGVANQNNNSDNFLPATATEFMGITPNEPGYLDRGSYTVTNGKSTLLNGDFGASYSFIFGKSQVFSNLIYSVQQSSSNSTGVTMVGFPNDKLDNISFGNEYEVGSKADGSESTIRNVGIISAVNYSYDNRFLADFSYRANASSQFGANHRWGSFWSTGLGWNIHHEEFMKSLPFVDRLKLRGSTGYTGSQNFGTYQSIATYNYVTNQSYNGDLGLQLLSLANPNLKWQQGHKQ